MFCLLDKKYFRFCNISHSLIHPSIHWILSSVVETNELPSTTWTVKFVLSLTPGEKPLRVVEGTVFGDGLDSQCEEQGS